MGFLHKPARWRQKARAKAPRYVRRSSHLHETINNISLRLDFPRHGREPVGLVRTQRAIDISRSNPAYRLLQRSRKPSKAFYLRQRKERRNRAITTTLCFLWMWPPRNRRSARASTYTIKPRSRRGSACHRRTSSSFAARNPSRLSPGSGRRRLSGRGALHRRERYGQQTAGQPDEPPPAPGVIGYDPTRGATHESQDCPRSQRSCRVTGCRHGRQTGG